MVCPDGTARSITARIVADAEPLDRPCDYAGLAVKSQACAGAGGEVRDCGACTSWVLSP